MNAPKRKCIRVFKNEMCVHKLPETRDVVKKAPRKPS